MKRIAVALFLATIAADGRAETLTGLCMISAARTASHRSDTADVLLRRSDCGDEGPHCGTSENSNIPWSRWAGVTPQVLQGEGAQLTGQMDGDAGTLTCAGSVHDGVLAGRYQFTPSSAFAQKMTAMGFGGLTSRKQETFLMLDIDSGWVQQIKDAGVTELSTDRLVALRALGVDVEYIREMTAAGYPELRANKLTEMKAVGVTPEKAKEAKALGFKPTEQELIEMSIFKVDKPFIERMRAKGLQDLTVSKLIKVKIFKLED